MELLPPLAAAFVGAIFGSVSSHFFQHRLWLRDARRQAYLDVMAALDDLQNATETYSHSLHALAEVSQGQASEHLVAELRRKCDQEWQATRSREVAVQRAETGVELVGSWLPWATASMVRHTSFIHVAHWRDSTPEDMREAVERMRKGQADARQLRKSLLAHAKVDLGIDQSLGIRARRLLGRTRSRLARAVKALRRTNG